MLGGLQPDAEQVERFTRDLDAVMAPAPRIGVAVSGGPDSLALLLLAAAVRPGTIEAATIDHGLRPESPDEAAMVGQLCQRLAVPHVILTARWQERPATAIQERARRERYRLLGFWAEERGLGALMTAHHADDQAETLLMRLARGSGVRGLAGMRSRAVAPGTEIKLVRPLLGWRRAELERICADAGLTPAADPSNEDDRYERVRVRRTLAAADWLDRGAVARSAAHLAEADEALRWATAIEWNRAVHEKKGSISYRPGAEPMEIHRRIVTRAVRKLATEGDATLRGVEIDRLMEMLANGGTATLRGVACSGGPVWQFTRAAPRNNY